MPVRTRIALGTLCVFNAAIVAALGFIFLIYVNGRAGPVAAVLMWISAGVLAALAHRLRRGTDW